MEFDEYGAPDQEFTSDANTEGPFPPPGMADDWSRDYQQSGLRLAVVGTSNAVLKDGYVPGLLSTPYFSVVRKHCVGGSPAALLSVVGEEMNPADYDVCLIDTCINDDVHFDAKCQTALDAYEHTLCFMRKLAQAGCMPFLLAMHEVDDFGRKTAASEMYRALAERFGCGYYDARWFFQKHTRGKQPLDLLFRDKAHPNPETSLALGREVARHVNELPRPWAPSNDLDLGGPEFRLIRPSQFRGPGREPVTHKSSLRSDTFLPLHEGESVEVQLGAGERLCGFVFNAVSSAGCLEIQSPRSRSAWNVASMSSHKMTERGLKFLSQVAPIPDWSTLSGRIHLSLARAAEGARHIVGADMRAVERAYVEFGALIVRCSHGHRVAAAVLVAFLVCWSIVRRAADLLTETI